MRARLKLYVFQIVRPGVLTLYFYGVVHRPLRFEQYVRFVMNHTPGPCHLVSFVAYFCADDEDIKTITQTKFINSAASFNRYRPPCPSAAHRRCCPGNASVPNDRWPRRRAEFLAAGKRGASGCQPYFLYRPRSYVAPPNRLHLAYFAQQRGGRSIAISAKGNIPTAAAGLFLQDANVLFAMHRYSDPGRC